MAVATLPRERETRPLLARIGSVMPFDDEVVALGVAREVAVDDRRLDEALGVDAVEPHAQARTALLLDELLIGGSIATGRLQSPLAEEQRTLVEVRRVFGQGDPADDPLAEKRCNRHRHVGGDVGPRRHVGRLGDREGRGDGLHAARTTLGEHGPRLAPLDGHDGVHEPKALERIAGVADIAVVHLGEILLDECSRERGPAQEHGVSLGDAPGVQFLEVLLHDDGALHEQSAHADGVGAVALGSLDDGRDRLLDADVHDGVAVVAQDDVDEVLADVVDIALHSSEHHGALAGLIGALHMRF